MGTPSTDPADHSGFTGDGSTPWWAWGCSAELSAGDRENYKRFHWLLLAWAVVLVAATLCLKLWGDAMGLAAYLVALVPTGIFLLAARAYLRFLRGADELTRKIHLEGMAIGFAVAIVILLAYPALEIAGADPLNLQMGLVMPTVLGYSFGVYRAQRRYR